MLHNKRSKTKGQPPTITVKDENNEDKLVTTDVNTRLLGANVGQDLGWRQHLEEGHKAILPRLRQQLWALHMIAQYLPRKSRLNLANAFLISRVREV